MIVERMAADLGVNKSFIVGLARGASHAYKRYSIPKRGGGKREIHHPSKQLKALQRWLLQYVIPGFPVHKAATAYRKTCSIFDNAQIHIASKYLLRMDFQEFFPSITEADLRRYIEERRSSLFVDWTLSDIEVFCMIVLRRSHLTIGAPTSPALSNAICFEMDTTFFDIATRRGAKYTRYADDLFFSTTQPDILRALQTEIENAVSGLALPANLAINPGKTRHSSRRRARRVTGLVLGSDQKVHIGRALKRRIRALVHNIDSLDFPARKTLAGLLAYAIGFDPGFMNSLILKCGHAAIEKARHPAVK